MALSILLHPPTALWRREALAASRGTFWVRMDGASSLRIYIWTGLTDLPGAPEPLDSGAPRRPLYAQPATSTEKPRGSRVVLEVQPSMVVMPPICSSSNRLLG